MRVDVRVEGVREVAGRLQRLAEAYPNATMAAINAEAEDIFVASQERVPVDTGNLKSSGYVRRALGLQGMEVGYGGEQAPYALLVHETHHDPYHRKYLEAPFRDALGGMRGRIIRAIRREVGL